MARDLHAVGAAHEPVESHLDPDGDLTERQGRLDLDSGGHIDRELRSVRREQRAATVAGMLLDAQKLVEPFIELLCDRALRWAALISTVGLTAYALKAPSWERLATVAVFAVLAPWIIRKGR